MYYKYPENRYKDKPMKFIRIFALLPFLGVVSIMNISARSLSSDLKTLAQNSRYKMIEIDARVTKDSVIVNFHDPYIDATTNGTGVLGAMTYNDSSTFVAVKTSYDFSY